MPTPSALDLTYTDILKEVCFCLGYGRTSSAWSIKQIENADSCIQTGLRRVLNPPPLNPNESAHQWSWLQPTGQFTSIIGRWQYFFEADYPVWSNGVAYTAYTSSAEPSTVRATTVKSMVFVCTTGGTSGTVEPTWPTVEGGTVTDGSVTWTAYASVLPTDFGGMMGNLTWGPQIWPWEPVQETNEARIRTLRMQTPFQTGSIIQKPRYYAQIVLPPSGTAAQRWKIQLWPVPNSADALTFRYRLYVNQMSSSFPYPPGGSDFGDLIMEAAMGVAEERNDDQEGVHSRRFAQLLAAAVSTDKERGRTQNFGYNGNREQTTRSGLGRHWGIPTMTAFGVPIS